jgi:signal transduction histidine kinase
VITAIAAALKGQRAARGPGGTIVVGALIVARRMLGSVRAQLLVVASAAACWAALAYLGPVPDSVQADLPQKARAIAAGFFLIAAAGRLVQYRVEGRLGDARLGAMIAAASVATVLGRIVADAVAGGPNAHRVALTAELLPALLWLVAAIPSRQQGWHPACRWTALGLLAMATNQSLRGVVAMGHDELVPSAVGAQLIAASVCVALVTISLVRATRPDEPGAVLLAAELAQTQRELAHLRRAQRERLHDARSAVAGLLGASTMLARGRNAAVDPERVGTLLAAEATRLQALLDVDVVEPITEFGLRDALLSVLLAHELDGAAIHAEIGDVRVSGRARATASAIDNLIRNARTHAPGAAISVYVMSDAQTASVVVEDDGPGIPRAERERVLLAGVRGSTARGAGSGLGLHNAASTMGAQSGALRLCARTGGGTRVVCTLPLAVTQRESTATVHRVAS